MGINRVRSEAMPSKRAGYFVLAAGFLCITTAAIFHCGISYGSESSFNASIAVREEYDDNIFLTRKDREFDYITRVFPYVGVTYKTTWLDLKLDDKFYYWHYARQATDYYSNDLNLVSKLTVIRNLLYVDLNDTYSSVVLEPRGPSTEANRNINRTDTNVVNASPYLKYNMTAASSITAGGTYTNIWYRKDGTNRQQYKGFLAIEQKFSPTFSALLGGEYLADRPQGEENSNNQTAAFASVSSIITPRLRFGATGGFRWLRYTNNRDYDRAIYNAGLVYELPSQGRVELRASSVYGTTPLFGVVKNDRQEAVIVYFISPTVASIKGSVYHTQIKYAEIIRTDEAHGFSAGFDYTPIPRLRWQVSGAYERARYSPQVGRRTVYYVSTGLDYKITPKVILGLTYSYNNSRGGVETENYFDNLAGVQLKAEL